MFKLKSDLCPKCKTKLKLHEHDFYYCEECGLEIWDREEEEEAEDNA